MGRGPYTASEPEAFDKFADKLAKIWAQLREASNNESCQIEWAPFDELQAQAVSATGEKRSADAVRHYARAISTLMSQLRGRRGKNDD